MKKKALLTHNKDVEMSRTISVQEYIIYIYTYILQLH